MDLFSGADLVDLVLPFLHMTEKHPKLSDSDLLLLSVSLDILYLSCEQEGELSKYLLASTDTQSQLLHILSCLLVGNRSTVRSLLESLARLRTTLSVQE